MVQRNRLLDRAIKTGEAALRSTLNDMLSQRGRISSALCYCEKDISSDDVIHARQWICELDRLINYITTALSHLPQNKIARAEAIQTAIQTVLHLGTN